MEFNLVATGIELIGTTIKELSVENSIVDLEKEGKRNLGLNINEPMFQEIDNGYFAQMTIDFDVELEQAADQECVIHLSLEGAFLSEGDIEEDEFKKLVVVNGAAALIGIARGKLEVISATVFNDGKILIPFINVVDYYKSLEE